MNSILALEIRLAIPPWYAGCKGGWWGIDAKSLIALKKIPSLAFPAEQRIILYMDAGIETKTPAALQGRYMVYRPQVDL